jgi:hypothetical protein
MSEPAQPWIGPCARLHLDALSARAPMAAAELRQWLPSITLEAAQRGANAQARAYADELDRLRAEWDGIVPNTTFAALARIRERFTAIGLVVRPPPPATQSSPEGSPPAPPRSAATSGSEPP